jgi:hypothetical protein
MNSVLNPHCLYCNCKIPIELGFKESNTITFIDCPFCLTLYVYRKHSDGWMVSSITVLIKNNILLQYYLLLGEASLYSTEKILQRNIIIMFPDINKLIHYNLLDLRKKINGLLLFI